MAEQFLTLMADLDDETQERLSSWYAALHASGFVGTQTPGLPYHISMATYPLSMEAEAIRQTAHAASAFAPIQVDFSHIGLFASGKVLFAAPERSPMLDALHAACELTPNPRYPWTPHATLLIDTPETVHQALPLLMQSFRPFVGTITHLHLCAFWPTRDIVQESLSGTP